LLNALMARAPDAPLGPPEGPERPSQLPALEQLERARVEGRPELAAAAGTLRRSQAMLEAAQIGVRRPSFMVGADYWWMPLLEMPHAYGLMVSMSLPWLVSGRHAELREAEQLAAAERHAAEGVDRLTAFELHDAMARLRAADHALAVIEGSVLPQAENSLAASQAAFALGNTSLLSLLDTMRAFFEIRLEHSRALSRVMTELAQLEFASGRALLSPREEQP
jgi:outer membrane protein TolC